MPGMRSLIIGGTRNLGPSIVQALLQEGHEVAVFNRGQTRDVLPEEVERLRGDRTDPEQLKRALAEAKVKPTARAETLSLESSAAIFRALRKAQTES